ncbi:unnamed protein product [Effrenium voratum]|uniref:Uncharacterized protein n=1 Tax=Effrenium voratum TaxID=2562239 RepID=A0AA36NA43_9DINO|nr:unnamed protein product [Effrenium voratum]
MQAVYKIWEDACTEEDEFGEVEGFHSEVEDFENETSKAADYESLRQEARDTLLKAAMNGTLGAAFRTVRGKAEPAEPPVDVEALRSEARDALLKAAQSGRLANAFRQMREKDETEVLREQARDTLLAAAGDGRLSAALHQARSEAEIETLRSQAAGALLRATADGRLKEALLKTREDAQASALEAARLEARATLVRAAMDGRLSTALETAREESLRLEARDLLLSAARDGRLTTALQSVQKDPVEAVREKARLALMKTAEGGKLESAMAEIMETRKASEAQVEPTPFQFCPSVGTWMLPTFKVQPAVPQPAAEEAAAAVTEAAPAKITRSPSISKLTGKTKRRIIGAVVRAPSESVPVDPAPPVSSPKSDRRFILAGSPSNALRHKEPMSFHIGEESEKKGFGRQSSISAMFEAMGATELYRMDSEEAPAARPTSGSKPGTPGRMAKSASTGSVTAAVSAMALDLGLGGQKDRIGTPSMGSRCSSAGSLKPLKTNKFGKARGRARSRSRGCTDGQAAQLPFLKNGSTSVDWSISHVSVMLVPAASDLRWMAFFRAVLAWFDLADSSFNLWQSSGAGLLVAIRESFIYWQG